MAARSASTASRAKERDFGFACRRPTRPRRRAGIEMSRRLLELAPLSPERGGIDAEDLGSLFCRGRAGEHFFDVLALELLEREVSADLQSVAVGHRGADALGKSRWLDELRGPKNGHTLDDIAQLAHVARPAVARQGFLRRGRERERRA